MNPSLKGCHPRLPVYQIILILRFLLKLLWIKTRFLVRAQFYRQNQEIESCAHTLATNNIKYGIKISIENLGNHKKIERCSQALATNTYKKQSKMSRENQENHKKDGALHSWSGNKFICINKWIQISRENQENHKKDRVLHSGSGKQLNFLSANRRETSLAGTPTLNLFLIAIIIIIIIIIICHHWSASSSFSSWVWW